MSAKMKRAALKTLTSPALRGLFRRWTLRTVPIVMLHRFSPKPRPGRVSRSTLERSLCAVRDVGLRPLSLGALVGSLARGSVPPRSICFTVDDGYRDFSEVAHPVFRQFDVPVTVFLTTGFVDGTMWNWWDRIRFSFERTNKVSAVLLDAADRPLGEWTDRNVAAERLMASCKEVSDDHKQSAIERLEKRLEVDLPERPVADYAAMDWDTVVRLSSQGVEFGGHTVTHPILSRVDDARLRSEVETSIAVVRHATGREVRCFAYPNGRNRDFDDRAVELLRELGIAAAVTTEYGIVNHRTLAAEDGLYRLSRVALGQYRARQLALFSGLEAAKMVGRT